jgi:hypothetical protein
MLAQNESVCTRGMQMTKVDLGSNDFYGVPFPLVIGDRYVHVYAGTDGAKKIDVFRWDAESGTAEYEVLASVPVSAGAKSNPSGIVTFVAEDGGFLFKFRPDPDKAQLFGDIPAAGDLRIRLRDDFLAVLNADGTPRVTFSRNSITGMAIGIRVGADGSVGMGSNALPAGMRLVRVDKK